MPSKIIPRRLDIQVNLKKQEITVTTNAPMGELKELPWSYISQKVLDKAVELNIPSTEWPFSVLGIEKHWEPKITII